MQSGKEMIADLKSFELFSNRIESRPYILAILFHLLSHFCFIIICFCLHSNGKYNAKCCKSMTSDRYALCPFYCFPRFKFVTEEMPNFQYHFMNEAT